MNETTQDIAPPVRQHEFTFVKRGVAQGDTRSRFFSMD